MNDTATQASRLFFRSVKAVFEYILQLKLALEDRQKSTKNQQNSILFDIEHVKIWENLYGFIDVEWEFKRGTDKFQNIVDNSKRPHKCGKKYCANCKAVRGSKTV